jgi:glycosyltransferase involved in cell wall biosynthesis
MKMEGSIIIPTLHRPKDLAKALDNFLDLSTLPSEIIIIDQSDDTATRDVCQKAIYEKLHIKYHHSRIKSSSLARNLAIDLLSPRSDIVIFLDDDVTLQADFLDEIQKFFLQHPHTQGGTANIESPTRKISFAKKI